MGEPRITGDAVTVGACNSYAPHFHSLVLGPVPFGRPPGERVQLYVSPILVLTAEEAGEVVWAWVQRTCENFAYPYDPDEWDVQYILPRNCN